MAKALQLQYVLFFSDLPLLLIEWCQPKLTTDSKKTCYVDARLRIALSAISCECFISISPHVFSLMYLWNSTKEDDGKGSTLSLSMHAQRMPMCMYSVCVVLSLVQNAEIGSIVSKSPLRVTKKHLEFARLTSLWFLVRFCNARTARIRRVRLTICVP